MSAAHFREFCLPLVKDGPSRIQDGLCFSPSPFRRRQDPIVQWGPAEDRMLAISELQTVLRTVIPGAAEYTLQHPVVISNEPGAPQQQLHKDYQDEALVKLGDRLPYGIIYSIAGCQLLIET